MNNYRGISLLAVTYKILSACLLERTQKLLEPKISDFQAGFRSNRSCPELILNLKLITRMRQIRRKPTIYVFVDFKKAYDSIHRPALFQILEEQGLDQKTRKIIEQTLTNTKSKVKFMGKLSKSFEIKTGVRQGDGLSPLLFNLVLDRVMAEWEKELKQENYWKPVSLGTKKDNLQIPYLAYADDLAIMADSSEMAIKQIETLKECAGKVGLQISFEKTVFTTTNLEISKLQTKYGEINRVPYFKYLGEVISEKCSQQERIQKARRGLGLVQNLYNKKCLSLNTKIKHYKTVIKPTMLYASETLTLNRKTDTENLKKEERKIIRKILGPRWTEEGYRLQKTSKIEEYSNIEIDMRKRRLKFYGHIMRLPDHRLTKRLVKYVASLVNGGEWIQNVKKDLELAKITSEDINTRNNFKLKVEKWEVKPETKAARIGTKWSEERKADFSQRMKTWWANKKNKKPRK